MYLSNTLNDCRKWNWIRRDLYTSRPKKRLPTWLRNWMQLSMLNQVFLYTDEYATNKHFFLICKWICTLYMNLTNIKFWNCRKNTKLFCHCSYRKSLKQAKKSHENHETEVRGKVRLRILLIFWKYEYTLVLFFKLKMLQNNFDQKIEIQNDYDSNVIHFR